MATRKSKIEDTVEIGFFFLTSGFQRKLSGDCIQTIVNVFLVKKEGYLFPHCMKRHEIRYKC